MPRGCRMLVVVALAACSAERAEDDATHPVTEERQSEPSPADPAPLAMTTFSEPTGDAVGGGIDLADTKVVVGDDGMLVIEVDVPGGHRAADHVEIYLDVDRDYEANGYDVRLAFVGHTARVLRFERGRWHDRTPATYVASFDHGIVVRVPIADLGIGDGFDFFVASIDEATGKVSDLSPDGALWQRWTYTR